MRTNVSIVAYSGGVSSSRLTTLGRNVRRLRARLGLSQKELADLAGVSSVPMIESGRRVQPRPETIEALARALGVTTLGGPAAAVGPGVVVVAEQGSRDANAKIARHALGQKKNVTLVFC